MKENSDHQLDACDLQHPLLVSLSNMAHDFAGIRFLIVFPGIDGWEQVAPGPPLHDDFCKLIQGTAEGAKHCRMCHILMSVAACSNSATEQTCHAGALVMSAPIGKKDAECFAVLSSCVFSGPDYAHELKETVARTGRLGIKASAVKQAFRKLPRLDEEKLKLVRAILGAAGQVVTEIIERTALRKQLDDARNRGQRGHDVTAAIREELRACGTISIPVHPEGRGARRRDTPALIDVVSQLVERKPNMPYSVAEIAAAARMTPNHFSSLFHKFTGQSFSTFLTEKRVELAIVLLPDLTRNITEVASACGYEDPGYFARVFKKQTGMSPREWRQAPGKR
jgi:AraC-like DNA-binding protein/ligand-binding sensor protein